MTPSDYCNHFAKSLVLMTVVIGVGCDSGSGESQTAPAMTLKQSLEKVTSLADKTTKGLSEGEMTKEMVEKAHEFLHPLGDLLTTIPALVKSSSLSDESKQTVQSAIESLTETFGKVDDKCHHGDPFDFSEFKEPIEDALGKIRETLKSMQ